MDVIFLSRHLSAIARLDEDGVSEWHCFESVSKKELPYTH